MNREDIIRMALEVGLEQDGDNFFSPKSDPQVDVHITDLEAFAALVRADERDRVKEALAQPEQESLEYWNAVEGWVKIDEVRQHFDSVGCGTIYKTSGEDRVPIYTTPPQRKPLTEQEIGAILEDINAFGTRLYTFARAIEAAHGIKGEA